MKSKQIILGQTLAFGIMTLFGFWLGSDSRQSEIDNMQSRLDRTFKHWDSKVGGTTLWPDSKGENINYNLKSFDSGNTWYAVEYDDNWGMKIAGEAEVIYPGLIKSLEGRDQLFAYVENNGPVTLKDGLNGKEAELLRSAGFEVVEK
jgi:hypothetical protein